MTGWQKLNKFEQTIVRIVWLLSPMGLIFLGFGLLLFSPKTIRYTDFKNIINN